MSKSTFRLTGRLDDVMRSPGARVLLNRSTTADERIRTRTAEIVARVRRDGDTALAELAFELDGVTLAALEVPAHECRRALDSLDPVLRDAMTRAKLNIATAHRAFRPIGTEIETEPGVLIGRRPDPLDIVGVYAPGGRAAYPSSVLMGIVPARVAGVRTVILCSPPGPSGLPSDVVLAAAALGGADRVFALGGAGAIAAMAYGTATVPAVQRIVGPGNAYVAEAKLQISSVTGIDSPAGPSELLVIADATASADVIAREALAQAEHDPLASVVVVCTAEAVARAVERAMAILLPSQERRETIAAALGARGALMWSDTLAEALEFSARYGPEHLLLAVANPDAVVVEVRNAGTVFLGESSSVSFGDYMTGANHVLPTGALARCYSGLSTVDFMRWTTYQRVTPVAAARLADAVDTFARSEGLGAHAAAARAWRPES